MLDIHPAHHSATTWRDFFIHIATICLGLLIAIGLEQTVEAIHRAHERRELVADMREESRRNVITLHHDIDVLIDRATWDLAVMKTLQTATPRAGMVTVTLPQRALGGIFVSGDRAVWAIAQANGKAALLSEQDAETYARLDFEAEDATVARTRDTAAGNDLRAERARLRIRTSPGA